MSFLKPSRIPVEPDQAPGAFGRLFLTPAGGLQHPPMSCRAQPHGRRWFASDSRGPAPRPGLGRRSKPEKQIHQFLSPSPITHRLAATSGFAHARGTTARRSVRGQRRELALPRIELAAELLCCTRPALHTLGVGEKAQGKEPRGDLAPDAVDPQGLEHRGGLQLQQGVTRRFEKPCLVPQVVGRQDGRWCMVRVLPEWGGSGCVITQVVDAPRQVADEPEEHVHRRRLDVSAGFPAGDRVCAKM